MNQDIRGVIHIEAGDPVRVAHHPGHQGARLPAPIEADGKLGHHFENILYDKSKGQFELLDWRQNFGTFLDIGDIYYDLAKLNHGLIICHELIAKDLFEVAWEGSEIRYDFNRKQSLVECEQHLYEWLGKNGYDVRKVKTMTALIFLNICALHDYPYSLLLYGLGKEMLCENLKYTEERDGK